MKLRHLLLCAMAAAASVVSAQTADLADMSLEDNINTPAIANKRRAAVKEKARKLSDALRKAGMSTNILREDEVVLATLPCDVIFAANATEPKYEALSRLRALAEVAGQPEDYKILVAVHSDDTGDDAYSDALTEARANALDDLLWQLADRKDTNVVIYGLGKDEPVNANDTRDHRRANRRVEFYIVPLR